MKAWIAKATVPAVLATGGVVAFALSSPTAASTTPRAWIDAPIAGTTFVSGPVAVQVHASASGGVDSIELRADGDTVALANPEGDNRLSRATISFNGNQGRHSLTVRAKADGTWGPLSQPIAIMIGTHASASPGSGQSGAGQSSTASTNPGVSSTSSSTTTPAASTTMRAVESSTTTPTTTTPSRPTTPGQPHPPTTLAPLRPPSVAVTSNEISFGDPVRFSAISDIDGPHTLTIELRYQTDSAFTTIASCSGSPCRQEFDAFRYYGTYYYRARIKMPDGRTATSSVMTLKVNPVKD